MVQKEPHLSVCLGLVGHAEVSDQDVPMEVDGVVELKGEVQLHVGQAHLCD